MMDQPTQSSAFGNARIDASAVARPSVRVGRAVGHAKKEAKVVLNKNGSTIESIHITCACGEEIVVNCVYSDDKS